MTIDHAHPEKYRLRNGCQVVRIIPTPEHCDVSQRLLILYRTPNNTVHEGWAHANGKVLEGAEHSLDLIPHDPHHYQNIYPYAASGGWKTLEDCRKAVTGPCIARIAVHASGKVRQIPLDATEDTGEQA